MHCSLSMKYCVYHKNDEVVEQSNEVVKLYGGIDGSIVHTVVFL